jgi:hypothetical protein
VQPACGIQLQPRAVDVEIDRPLGQAKDRGDLGRRLASCRPCQCVGLTVGQIDRLEPNGRPRHPAGPGGADNRSKDLKIDGLRDIVIGPDLSSLQGRSHDVNMPSMTGVDLYQRLIKLGHAIPTILITAYADEAVRSRALNDGVIGYLQKPVDEGGSYELSSFGSRSAQPATLEQIWADIQKPPRQI